VSSPTPSPASSPVQLETRAHLAGSHAMPGNLSGAAGSKAVQRLSDPDLVSRQLGGTWPRFSCSRRPEGPCDAGYANFALNSRRRSEHLAEATIFGALRTVFWLTAGCAASTSGWRVRRGMLVASVFSACLWLRPKLEDYVEAERLLGECSFSLIAD